MILETKYLSLTQMIVLSLATQACFSSSWQRSLCCKQHHNPLSSSPNTKVKWACGEADWSVRDASKVHFGNHTPLHKGLCSHLQHKLVCHLHGKLDCLGDSKQALCWCKWHCNPLSLSPTWSWTEPSTDLWSVIKWADAIPYTWRGILGREILLQTCNNTSIPSIATFIRSIQI
jgi:hypothetical protein